MELLVNEIRNCTLCSKNLPLGPRPVLRANPKSKVMIIGQAPGTAVHVSGIPWDDPSGRRLREWMGVSEKEFYNEEVFAIVPMGFCYPGKGNSGDLPPRPECAPAWHKLLEEQMPELELKILIGQYAIDYYLGPRKKRTLTETVKAFREYFPEIIVLPHPSPRNNIWLKKNEWFEWDVIPHLRKRIETYLKNP